MPPTEGRGPRSAGRLTRHLAQNKSVGGWTCVRPLLTGTQTLLGALHPVPPCRVWGRAEARGKGSPRSRQLLPQVSTRRVTRHPLLHL